MDHIKTDIKIGQNIFENIPKIARPNWGALILSRFDDYLDKIPNEILELYNIIDDSTKWNLAHGQFTAIRDLSLNTDDTNFELYLSLAEKIAKITYNESNEPAPFDSDSGYYIPMLALKYANLIDDNHLFDVVKSTILIFNRNRKLAKSINTSRDLITYKKIDDILWFDWDPIGVNDIGPRDEYSSYVPEILKMKNGGFDKDRVAQRLFNIERQTMGLYGDRNRCNIIADKILSI